MLKKFLSLLLCASFTFTLVVPPSYAQMLMGRDLEPLPTPGRMVELSHSVNPPVLRGIKVFTKDPLKFDFILDPGDKDRKDIVNGKIDPEIQARLKETSNRLLKYFLTTLTVPENDIWVNLSPYEKNRIIPETFGQTEMGRDLLGQDYLLKQITSSLMFPKGSTGKKFWAIVYEEAKKKFGSTQIPVNTFNKVWIMPDKAVVYEKLSGNQATAFVVESRLKVMLESDYIAKQGAQASVVGAVQSKPLTDTQKFSSDITREIILPVLEKEVNEGANFAPLRQVYSSILLALWYKNRMKGSILSSAYVNRDKIAGVSLDDKTATIKIWQQYLKAYKKGVFNLINEEKDTATNEIIPRKYFAGGFLLKSNDEAQIVTSKSIMTRGEFLAAMTGGLLAVRASLAEEPPGSRLPITRSSTPVTNSPTSAFTIVLSSENNPTQNPYKWGYSLDRTPKGAIEFKISYTRESPAPETINGESVLTTTYKFDPKARAGIIDNVTPTSNISTPIDSNTDEGLKVLSKMVQMLQVLRQLLPVSTLELDGYISDVEAVMPSISSPVGFNQNGLMITTYGNAFGVNSSTQTPGNIIVPVTKKFYGNSNAVSVDLYDGQVQYSDSSTPEITPVSPQDIQDWNAYMTNMLQTLKNRLQSSTDNDEITFLNGAIPMIDGWIKYGFYPGVRLFKPHGRSQWGSEIAAYNSLLKYLAKSTPLFNQLYVIVLKGTQLIQDRLLNQNTSSGKSEVRDRQRLINRAIGTLVKGNSLPTRYPSALEFNKLRLVGDPIVREATQHRPAEVRFDIVNPTKSGGETTTFKVIFLEPLGKDKEDVFVIDTALAPSVLNTINLLIKDFNNTNTLIESLSPDSTQYQIYSQRLSAILKQLGELTHSAVPNSSANPPQGIAPTPRPVKQFVVPTNNDQATVVEKRKGGIDFRGNSMPFDLRGNGGAAIIFHIDPTQLARINLSRGLRPQVFTIDPLQSLPTFLGMSKEEVQQMTG